MHLKTKAVVLESTTRAKLLGTLDGLVTGSQVIIQCSGSVPVYVGGADVTPANGVQVNPVLDTIQQSITMLVGGCEIWAVGAFLDVDVELRIAWVSVL